MKGKRNRMVKLSNKTWCDFIPNGGELESTGRCRYKRRAGVGLKAPKKGDQKLKCLWHENGGVSHHVLAATPIAGTDVNTSDGEADNFSCAVHRQIMEVDCGEGFVGEPDENHSTTHVDTYIEMLQEWSANLHTSTNRVVGQRVVSMSRGYHLMPPLLCYF